MESPLVGRAVEFARIGRVLDGARAGSSGALVLRGGAGIGKTALLEQAVGLAAGMAVARIDGVEAETTLGYAALHRLVAPFLPGRDELPPVQRDALGAAFGLVEAPPPDRFLLGLATLTLLTNASVQEPLVCVVDDAQWIDQGSLEVVAFVARRLGADRVAMLLSERSGPAGESPLRALPGLDVSPLGPDEAAELIARHTGIAAEARIVGRLTAECAGNPLALVEIARRLDRAQLTGTAPLPDLLPLGEQLETLFARDIRRLDPTHREVLLLAATDPSREPSVLLRAADQLSLTAAAVESVVDTGLLTLTPAVTFRHPLVRSAVYGAAAPAERRRAHAALAEVTDPVADADRRTWHLAAATLGPDEVVAAALEQSASRARARGGYAAELTSLERAADLTPDPGVRAGRLLGAVLAALKSGAFERGRTLLERATRDLDDPFLGALAQRLDGAMKSAFGETADAPVALVRAARAFQPFDANLARATSLDAINELVLAREMVAQSTPREVAELALSLPQVGGDSRPDELLRVGFATLITQGPAAGGPMIRRSLELLHPSDDAPLDEVPHWSMLVSIAAEAMWDARVRQGWLERVERLARATGAFSYLGITLYGLGICETARGRLVIAESRYSEARDVFALFGFGDTQMRLLVGPDLHVWRLSPGVRATIDASELAARELGSGASVRLARKARLMLELGTGHYREAFEEARRLTETDAIGNDGQSHAELVEAAVRCGEIDTAERAVAALVQTVTAGDTPWGLGVLAKSRALLVGDDDSAEQHFLDAIEQLERTVMRLDLARTHLLYGEWLRRRRRRTDARHHLRTAHEEFDSRGARLFLDRTRTELLATGEHPRRRTVDTTDDLTPQEAQVARLAAGGATNPEIATQLFISASTVEYHLRKVFRKLGISSRRQLQAALTGNEPADA